jgi:hypothetical protein
MALSRFARLTVGSPQGMARWLVWVLATIALFEEGSLGCPFCAKMTRTLSDEMREASAVVYAKAERSTADRAILHPEVIIRGSASQLPREILLSLAPNRTPPSQLFFLQQTPNGWKVNRLDTVSAEMVRYLQEVWKQRDRSSAERLEYFYTQLDSKDARVSADAYGEFARASYRATQQAAPSYEPDRVRGWINDPRVAPERIGLFGLMLGLSGRNEDFAFLEQTIRQPTGVQINGLDGLLGGLYLLDPKRGEEWIVSYLTSDDSSTLQRASALAALRFVLSDVPPRDPAKLLHRTLSALKDDATAGPLIDEFRKAKVWDAGGAILPLYDRLRDPTAVVRFGLSSPTKEAGEWVRRLEETAPAAVTDARQTLRFEADARQLDFRRPVDP